jgi:hypothetical protein
MNGLVWFWIITKLSKDEYLILNSISKLGIWIATLQKNASIDNVQVQRIYKLVYKIYTRFLKQINIF